MEDELPPIIPTSYRVKIPRALSYVTGAQIVSLAWQDVPQFEFLNLSFSCLNIAEALRHRDILRPLLEVSYRKRHVDQFTSHHIEGHYKNNSPWQVYVYVCHREDAPEIREWLQNEGLASARLWLERHANSSDEVTSLIWRAFFDEEARAFSITSRP